MIDSKCLAAMCLTALAACGPSEAEQKLEAERLSLRRELAEAKQYNADLKYRLQLAEARTKLLITLVQGLTIDPDHFGPQLEKLATADASLQALDRDIENLVASLRHSHGDVAALRAQREALQAELGQARHTIETARASQARLDARTATLQQILAPMTELIRAGRVNVSVVYGRFSIELPERALFAQNQALLSEDGKSLLDRVISGLRAATDRRYQLRGPVDPLDKRGAAQRELTLARGRSILDYLVERGVSAETAVTVSHDTRRDPRTTSTLDRFFAISLEPKAEEYPRQPSPIELLPPEPVGAES